MEPAGHSHADGAHTSLNRAAVQATLHCLTGCAIGEVLGMVVATALGWGNTASIAISVVLAFLFGYALTLGPILRAGVEFRRAAGLTLASDTLSITTMEIVDNAFILIVPRAAGLHYSPFDHDDGDRRQRVHTDLPGAISAGLADALFWWSLTLSLVIAFIVAVPVNRWLIARGRGHAVVHGLH